ncbi:helix-turn-helix domain-containing protein [Agrobacterium sp. Ap1]|uniref:helix-turn-helix domain-containing protein n=1 Tax=Agrobacterium sp. Ap1 TaxID=2815337 RepID=UPI001A902F61|nr:helix-turn-helix domain-containing protein [Agrobacterium sp. Ap1]MBO0142281.1 helix-turn-helix domain-containing protein [Agrobacterium sp. Ap1]
MDVVERLRDENEMLREKLRQLEDVLKPEVNAPEGCHLTPSELLIFRHLSLGRLSSRDNLRSILYSDRVDEPDTYNIIDVFIVSLRKKLRPYGFALETVWGRGWKLVRLQEEAE